MKILVFSDVHGNLPALEVMLKEAGAVDGYICLGDAVDYGPWSNECVDLITSLSGVVYVKGNHEQYFIDGEFTGENQIAKAFFDTCYPSFDRLEKIKNLPETYELNGFIFRHTILDRNIYPNTQLELDHNYVIGHSHHQFTIEQPPFVLYNPGSVGQNRKYINIINYATLDTNSMRCSFYASEYDEQAVISEMKRRDYPSICIEYYESKERYHK